MKTIAKCVDEIQFINKSKLKLITPSLETANKILESKEFNTLYKLNVPYDLCEVRGVVEIPHEYAESEIFQYLNIKHKIEYGHINHINDIKVVEVRRLSRRNNNNPPTRVDIDKVVVTFNGTILPSHVELDGLVYPVKSYVEPVLQCYKCFRFRHSTKVCQKTQTLCRRCAKTHPTSDQELPHGCDLPEYCVNCELFS